jgi:hypothetical protein
MYNVQKELHDLREKIHRNETVENKTEKVKKIEEERDWYRKEALRLDAFTTSVTKDLKYMREKLESIEEDRNWLEKQLKACKKQNKLLRAELDVRVSPGVATNAFDINLLPAFDSPKPRRRSSSRRPSDDDDAVARPSLPALAVDHMSSPNLVEEREEKFRKQIRALKRDLQQKNQEIASLRHQSQTSNERSHLENFFVQCVDSVKEEVVRRRLFGDKKEKTAAPRAPSLAERTRNQKHDVGAEFEDFSAADRVRVIERLLAHDEVLTLLYEQLFPRETPVGSISPQPRPASTHGESRTRGAALQSSDSSSSLPDPAFSTRRVTFEPADAGRAAGSGAAAASAARGNGLPIDESTRDYLRSM